MLHNLLNTLDKTVKFERVSAHCDVPCGIYDPSTAQVAALTVVRTMDQLKELEEAGVDSISAHAKLARIVAEKERSAKIVKEEVVIIWGDFIKAPQIEKFPNIHTLVHNIMMQGSKCKQHTDKEMSLDLLKLVNEFAEAFWAMKGVETYTATSPYAPAQPVVYPKLG